VPRLNACACRPLASETYSGNFDTLATESVVKIGDLFSRT
jgi:hypothetical protein